MVISGWFIWEHVCGFQMVGFYVVPHLVNGAMTAIDGECLSERCCERACILLLLLLMISGKTRVRILSIFLYIR